MLLRAVVLVLAADGAAFEKVTTIDGVTVEQRNVEGSKFVELRFSTLSDKTPQSLCDAAFGDGSFDPKEPDLKSRKILKESEDERITYDQITPPLVSNRDYVVKARRVREGEGCRMIFEATTDVAVPNVENWVRVTKLRGFWSFTPENGKTRIVYVVFTDPGGAIPPFLAEGSRRTLGVKWVKMIDSRGTKAP